MRWLRAIGKRSRGRSVPFKTVAEALSAGYDNLFVTNEGVWPMSLPSENSSAPQSSPGSAEPPSP